MALYRDLTDGELYYRILSLTIHIHVYIFYCLFSFSSNWSTTELHQHDIQCMGCCLAVGGTDPVPTEWTHHGIQPHLSFSKSLGGSLS